MTSATKINSSSEPRSGTLKEQIVEAASRLLIEAGYSNLSLRSVAKAAGCSQMAMYRHFANKDALIQHLCVELYTRFTVRMLQKINSTNDPRKQIHIFVSELVGFAVGYPDHYSLLFLVRHESTELNEQRDRLGREFLQTIRRNIQQLLPPDAEKTLVDTRLRQIVTTLHGAAALLIAHPKAYSLTRDKVIRDTGAVVDHLLP